MNNLALTALAITVFLACSPLQSVYAYQTKNDKEIVKDVNDIMTKMSETQREAVLQQAEAIKEHLRNMSLKERNELIKTVRDVSNNIEFEKVKSNELEAIKPSSLDETMKNFKKYQERF